MRQILCSDCAGRYYTELHPEDVVDGFVMRRTNIAKAKRPEDENENRITITGGAETTVIQIPHDEVICDGCSANVYNSEAVAVTMWHRDQEEPPMWEDGFTG